MKMWQKVLAGLGVVVVAFLAAASMQPDTFEVHRSIEVKASADKTYAQVADFHAWEAWSPWAKLDPKMTTTYTGPATGVGQKYAWSGNDDVGSGSMEFTAQDPGKKLTIKLDFLTPFEAHNITTFDFASAGDTTKVTWSMTGPNNFMSKVMGLVMSMDSMVGGDFEKGLAGIKVQAEKP